MRLWTGGLSLMALTAGILVPGGADGIKKAKPTYAEDIAPILNSRCVTCHRPGEVAPFSLIGYESAKKWAPMISQTTQSRRMPPWKAVAGYGEFHDENRLDPTEIDLLKAWKDTGATRGDAKKEPAAPAFGSAWTLGDPDKIIQLEKPFKLAATGEDVYRNFVFKTDFKVPMYVSAMDVRPGNPRIVHHVLAFLDNGGNAQRLELESKDGQAGYTTVGGGVGFIPSGALGGWAPGVRARHTPADAAFRIDPGASVIVQIHYHRSGKAEEDQTKLGLYFRKEPAKRDMQLAWILNPTLNIPPGKSDYKITTTLPIPANVTLYGVMPHMHLLGRDMKAWVEFPDGSKKPLIHVDDWDFNWQLTYSLKTPMKIPSGSKIKVEGIYDNSAQNPSQPNDPPKRITWGEETTDEMFLLIGFFTVD